MKFLIFTEEEINGDGDGDGQEEKLPSFESIVDGKDEDERVWNVIFSWYFALITIWDFLFKLFGFLLSTMIWCFLKI